MKRVSVEYIFYAHWLVNVVSYRNIHIHYPLCVDVTKSGKVKILVKPYIKNRLFVIKYDWNSTHYKFINESMGFLKYRLHPCLIL